MSERRAMRTLALTVAVTAMAPAAAAHADKLPVPDNAGAAGITSSDGGSRYVTRAAGPVTLVRRVDPRAGRIVASARIRGRFAVPAVALDGTPSGLSHDGGTLVLVRRREGVSRGRITLAIFDARQLGLRRVVTLRGDFSFDALSPDGRTAYLVQYLVPSDPTRYLVRALDPARGRLLAKPVVDPHESADAMRGFPVTRLTGPGGRWQYTLYDGAGGAPFVHALDTQARRARCIDLPMYADPARLHLAPTSGGGFDVVGPSGTVAHVDGRTFEVSRPGSRKVAAAPVAESGGGADLSTWVAVAAAIALILLAGAMRRRRRLGLEG